MIYFALYNVLLCILDIIMICLILHQFHWVENMFGHLVEETKKGRPVRCNRVSLA